MRDTDILLDIGAHVGSITIPAARKVKHVFAFESLFTDELRENVRLNGLTNVTIFPLALGNGSTIDLKFFDSKKIISKPIHLRKLSLSVAKKMIF
jgi:FkbM family methyltransferase